MGQRESEESQCIVIHCLQSSRSQLLPSRSVFVGLYVIFRFCYGKPPFATRLEQWRWLCAFRLDSAVKWMWLCSVYLTSGRLLKNVLTRASIKARYSIHKSHGWYQFHPFNLPALSRQWTFCFLSLECGNILCCLWPNSFACLVHHRLVSTSLLLTLRNEWHWRHSGWIFIVAGRQWFLELQVLLDLWSGLLVVLMG